MMGPAVAHTAEYTRHHKQESRLCYRKQEPTDREKVPSGVKQYYRSLSLFVSLCLLPCLPSPILLIFLSLYAINNYILKLNTKK